MTPKQLSVVGLAAALLAVTGCGPGGGALLYFAGVGQTQKVEARYTLGEGPILVLVDDFNERLTWPETQDLLAEQTADELLARKATKKIISCDALRRLRQARPDFDRLCCNEIGRLIGADQIVWLEVADFFASQAVEDTGSAARMAVTVKVVNPRGTRKDGTVRLWPKEHDGQPVKAALSSNDVSRAGSRRAIAEALSSKLAVEVARLFYDHTAEDLVKP
ncbi:MAG: hypothetical protein JSV19_09630 [Phycisphaerales bacterium]|nr:MAG: hypothetical protein JSV19_09630 [Phycisphaerales bacterium]